jgi:hypothetical protein
LEKVFHEQEQYIDDFRDIVGEMFTIDQVEWKKQLWNQRIVFVFLLMYRRSMIRFYNNEY